MKLISRRSVLRGAVTVAIGGTGSVLRAESGYPNNLIKVIVPYPPGGTTDVIARVFAEALSKELGQQLVVDNRSGAGGSIGAQIIATSPPDGYTLGIANTSTHGTDPAIYKSLRYDPLANFSFITKLMNVPGVIAVHPRFPAKNFNEFMRVVRASPGRYDYASSGLGGANHMCMELFKFRTQTSITHIAYRGAGPAINDVVAGQVPIIWDALPSSLPYIKAGRLVPIGIVARERSPQLPDVPTFTELGVKDYEPEVWVGIVAPGPLPKDIQERLYRASMGALKRADVRKQLEELGGRVVGNTPEQFVNSVRADIERWKAVAKFANISLD